MKDSIIFLRVAWMINYKGVRFNDIPDGAGSYVTEHHDGGEVMNFSKVKNKYYGFARIQNDRNLRIERLGASNDDDFLDDITVVFFATDPTVGGQFVVGWYDKARLFRKVQKLTSNKRNGYGYYLAVAQAEHAKLLTIGQRKFPLPIDGPGQTNAWYVQEYRNANKYLTNFKKFKQNPDDWGVKPKPGGKKGWQVNAEKKKEIEIAAMDATYEYFVSKGFIVKYVHKENLGWDMEANNKKISFKLEVKGTSLGLNKIDLTPNEYFNSKAYSNYIICIFEHALNLKKAKLHICHFDGITKKWISDTGNSFEIIDIISAQIKLI